MAVMGRVPPLRWRILLSALLAACCGPLRALAISQAFDVEASGHLRVAEVAAPGETAPQHLLLRKEAVADHSNAASNGEATRLASETPAVQIAPRWMPGAVRGAPRNMSLLEGQSSGVMQCGWTAYAPDDPCPVECPYLSEESWNPCHFQCVSADQCGILDKLAIIADDEEKRCRRCIIPGCDECAFEKDKDACRRCSVGYFLDEEGTCYTGAWPIWFGFKTIAFFLVFIIAVYLFELAVRMTTNPRGARHGRSYQKRTRIHMPRETHEKLGVRDPEDSAGLLYPLLTNTLTTPVGGPGCTMHFNFQAFIIVWAIAIAGAYTYFAVRYGYDLLRVGTMPAKTPQELCSILRWGEMVQATLMQQKVWFLWYAYLITTFASIAYAAYASAMFKKLDNCTTMRDYACLVRGLPTRKGTEDVEGEFKDFLERETGEMLVGVSVCWNYQEVEEQIDAALELEAANLEDAHYILKHGQPPPVDEDAEEPLLGPITAAFHSLDKHLVVDPPKKNAEPEPTEVDVEKMRGLLDEMTTSDCAFAVFESEESRDRAVRRFHDRCGVYFVTNEGQPDEHKTVVKLFTKSCEPGTVRWSALSHGSNVRHRNAKLVVGTFFIVFALLAWCILIYVPYAYYVASFSYANGTEPGMVGNLVFSLLVAGGNQLMYFVCDATTAWADFAFEDDREVVYITFYLLSCFTNSVLDMAITAVLSYKEMVGLGVHTSDGRLLESLTRKQDIVEAYSMQKAMGRQLYAYCMPSCFLLPFMIEPIVTILLPNWLNHRILSSHPELQGRRAERQMEFFAPMNLGRYADVLLNVMLATLVFFFPGGFTLQMFMALALSHVYVYFYDHWRILRQTPDFVFSKDSVDMFAAKVMAVPCGTILACMVFKGYTIYWPDLGGMRLFCVMCWAFFGHIYFHLRFVNKIYAASRKSSHDVSDMTYAETAQWTPKTWFSANPIHCLRSKYVWDYKPPQVYCMLGKEHLLRANPEIGSFYENKAAQQPEPEEEEFIGKKIQRHT